VNLSQPLKAMKPKKDPPQTHAPRRLAASLIAALMLGSLVPAACAAPLIFSCAAGNDLLRVASANGLDVKRFDAPLAAVEAAGDGDGVLLLADAYPAQTTALDSALFQKAAGKHLRLYVEYPSFLPGTEVGAPRGTQWERAVIASDAFAPALTKLRILAIHGCRFLPVKADKPHIVIGRVAGFDTAVYGLAQESYPILFDLPPQAGAGNVLVATTKLSDFVTGRYAPTDAWQGIWSYVFTWLRPGRELAALKWTASVRPSFGAGAALPADIEAQALRRGIDWYFNSRMVVHPSMMAKYDRPCNEPVPAVANPDLKQDWPFGHRTARMPDLSTPMGDGSLGVMEGFDAKIFHDGTQPVRWWNRNDCNGEIAGAMAVAGAVLQTPAYLKVAGNVGDWLYFKSRMSLGDHANPQHPAYGLIGWNDTPNYCGPGSMDGYAVYYGDDNARSMLGMMLAAATLKTDRFDERLMQCMLANLRLSGRLGFQPDRVDQGPLQNAGWQSFFNSGNTSYSPHMQATLWNCYLWAYQQTGFELFRQRAKTAIGMTMAAYPDQWVWMNGIQQERAKMLLALAWLVRVEDTPEHRAWLRRMADALLASQDACGAIREEIGVAGKGGFPPPASNEAYGTAEAPLIQSNADGASDLLYTCNFAFIALHEAAAATADPFYRTAEDKLAAYLCRIQIRSENHPELDGGWFRAFDFKRWEYWASSTDAGWGAWSIESGWTQSWITSVLALRQMKTSLWDLTKGSKIKSHFEKLRPTMLPDELLAALTPVKSASTDRPVKLQTAYAPQYPGGGANALTDGNRAAADAQDPAWQGYHGVDLDAVIDLGRSIPVRLISVTFCQNTRAGIYMPAQVEFAVSEAGKDFTVVQEIKPGVPFTEAGPVIHKVEATLADVTARYLRVRAVNVGKIPEGQPAAGQPAWLFVDEVLVNPVAAGAAK
jgi:hypothetical protein